MNYADRLPVPQIFKFKTGWHRSPALRYRLGPEHTYDFVEGSIVCEPRTRIKINTTNTELTAPTEKGVEPVSSSEDEFFAYFDETSPLSCRDTLEDLKSYIASSSSGPFDGVMAFSAGATLAPTLMVFASQNHTPPPFRLAIFFCGDLPGDPKALEKGKSRWLSFEEDGEVIEFISSLCSRRPDSVRLGESDGGVAILGGFDKGFIDSGECIAAMLLLSLAVFIAFRRPPSQSRMRHSFRLNKIQKLGIPFVS
ncbi:MAG: hypothetical protein Q9217_000852 [Psora testacea]